MLEIHTAKNEKKTSLLRARLPGGEAAFIHPPSQTTHKPAMKPLGPEGYPRAAIMLIDAGWRQAARTAAARETRELALHALLEKQEEEIHFLALAVVVG